MARSDNRSTEMSITSGNLYQTSGQNDRNLVDPELGQYGVVVTLLRPKRLQHVDTRGTPSWNQRRGYRGGDEQGHGSDRRDDARQIHVTDESRGELREDVGADRAGDDADAGNDDAFGQYLRQDLTRWRPDRQPHAELAGPR